MRNRGNEEGRGSARIVSWLPRFLMIGFLVPIADAGKAAPNIRYGQWEFEMTVKAPMFPQGVTQKIRECITPENAYPKPRKSEACPVQKTKVEKNTVRWEMVCEADGRQAKGTGEITYAGTTSDGTMKMTTEAQGRKLEMDYRMKGRWLGDCP